MMENEISFAWYRLRGLGLLCLCSFVFFFGAYLANQRSMAVNGIVSSQTMPIDCVQGREGALALSFDVTGGCGSIGTILNILRENDVRASFFVTTEWVDAYPEETKRIAAEGHDIGSRGFDRESMTGRPSGEIRKALEETSSKVQNLTGSKMTLFRAPYGEYNSTLVGIAASVGFLPVRWSVDSEDWKDYGVESIVSKVTQSDSLGSGAIVRMHGGAKNTAQALEAIIENLRQQGYALEPISQLLTFRAPASPS